MDHEGRLRELSNSLKHNNIRIIGVPEEQKEKGAEGLFEQITAENFPNLGKDIDLEIQETQRTPIKFNESWPSSRHIIVKFTKYTYKERILKAAREKQPLTYKGKQIRFAADLSTETCQARRESHDIFNVLKGKKYAAKNTLSSKAVIQNRRRDKEFPR